MPIVFFCLFIQFIVGYVKLLKWKKGCSHLRTWWHNLKKKIIIETYFYWIRFDSLFNLYITSSHLFWFLFFSNLLIVLFNFYFLYSTFESMITKMAIRQPPKKTMKAPAIEVFLGAWHFFIPFDLSATPFNSPNEWPHWLKEIFLYFFCFLRGYVFPLDRVECPEWNVCL